MAKTYRELDRQLQNLEKEVIEQVREVFDKKTSHTEETLRKVEDSQNDLKRRIEAVVEATEKNREEEKKIMEKLERKYKKKFSVKELLEIIYEND